MLQLDWWMFLDLTRHSLPCGSVENALLLHMHEAGFRTGALQFVLIITLAVGGRHSLTEGENGRCVILVT